MSDEQEQIRAAIGNEAMDLMDTMDEELVDQLMIVGAQVQILTNMLLARGMAKLAVPGMVVASVANVAAATVYLAI